MEFKLKNDIKIQKMEDIKIQENAINNKSFEKLCKLQILVKRESALKELCN